MKVLIDMNLSPRWATVLTHAGLEAVHWSRLGAGDAADIEIMAYARTNDYVVLTHDLDFAAILVACRREFVTTDAAGRV
jgi:predicted nuclease of predicted toxin-antitoxin system